MIRSSRARQAGNSSATFLSRVTYAGQSTVGQVGDVHLEAGGAVDVLTQDVGVAGVPGEVGDHVDEHAVERDVAVRGRPPRHHPGGVEREPGHRGVAERPHGPVEGDDLRRRDRRGHPPVGLRVGVVVGVRDEERVVGVVPLAPERRPEVADLHVGDVPDDAEQVRAGGCAREPQVALAEPLELPEERVARILEVVVEGFLGVPEIAHGNRSCRWRRPRSHRISGDSPASRLRSRVQSVKLGCKVRSHA